jgi:hypothetical protein
MIAKLQIKIRRFSMKHLVCLTFTILMVAGLISLSAYSQTVTVDVPDEVFGMPPFTDKTQTLTVSASEDLEALSVDLTLKFEPSEHIVATAVTAEGDFSTWTVTPVLNAAGSGAIISMFTFGAGAMIGTTPEPLLTLTFDSHANATPIVVTVSADSGGLNSLGTLAGDIPITVDPGDKALPTELSSFTAVPSDSGVAIKWRVESEINNLGFDVYRSESSDGRFVKINSAHIKGAGTDSTPRDYQFVDESAVVGKTYYYYLETISFSGELERSDIIKVIVDMSGKVKVTGLMQPKRPALLQNFPNPFNPETWIPFRLAEDADVTIRIFNIRGKEIRTVHLGQMPAGYYDTKGKAAFWDGRDRYGQEVSSGIYFYSLIAGEFHATKKLTIIK